MAISKDVLNLKVSFAPGEVIFSEGDASRDLYILLAGEVEVIQKGEKLASLTKSGAFFGEMALLLGQARSATLRAKEKVFLLKISPKQLPVMMKKMPDLAIKLARNLAVMVNNQNEQLLQSRDAVALRDLMNKELEDNPSVTLDEALPRLTQQVEQGRFERQLDVNESYLRSHVFVDPFSSSVEETLKLFYEEKVDVENSPGDAEAMEMACGVDFTGAMSGTFIFMTTKEHLRYIGKKLFGDEAGDDIETDTLKELTRRIIENTKKSVPGFNIELSHPEMLQSLDFGSSFRGIKLGTNVGFQAWVSLNL